MKVFVSWSGDYAEEVAKHLKTWVQAAFDDVNVWFSETDIEPGEIWYTKIRSELANTNFGIICLTEHSFGRLWVLFEAGALSKQLDMACVVPLLLGLKEEKMEQHPLSMFQSVLPTKEGMRDLFWKIYQQEQGKPVKRQSKEFEGFFTTYWKTHGKRFLDIVKKHSSTSSPASLRADKSPFVIERLHIRHE